MKMDILQLSRPLHLLFIPPIFEYPRFPALCSNRLIPALRQFTIKPDIMKPIRAIFPFLLIALTCLQACVTTAPFDQYAYAQTTAAKVEAMDLISNATASYSDFAGKAKEMELKLQKIYEYEKNRPKNGITVKMWELMLDPEKRLYAGFMKRWQTESKLSKTFVEEAGKLIGSGFDKIAELESKKTPQNEEALKSFQ